MQESNSRFVTSLLGRTSPFENSDVPLWTGIDLFIQANSDPKKKKYEPVPKPWDELKKTEVVETKSDTSRVSSDKFDRLQEIKDKLYKHDLVEIEEEINLFSEDEKNTEIKEEVSQRWIQE